MRYKIKERRKSLGMTQRELIQKSGISRATISILENGGELDIKVSTLRDLAKALKCSPASLFE